MATKKKITRKKLKEPDEFVSTTTEIYQWVLDNWIYFLSGVLVIAIIVGGVFFWRYQNEKREMAAFGLYHAIQVKVSRADAADAKACAGWDALLKGYAGTPAAVYGRLQKASCLLSRGDDAGCEATLKELMEMSDAPSMVKVMARLLKGYGLEEKKDYKGAEGVFSALLNSPDNFLKDTVRYHLYLCQMKQGKKDAAKKTLAGLKIKSGSDFALPVMLVKIEKAQLGIKE